MSKSMRRRGGGRRWGKKKRGGKGRGREGSKGKDAAAMFRLGGELQDKEGA
jgi:hypothetical protein